MDYYMICVYTICLYWLSATKTGVTSNMAVLESGIINGPCHAVDGPLHRG